MQAMKAQLSIDSKTSVLKGDLAPVAARLALGLEGRKTWISPNQLRFETSRSNLELAMSLLPTGMVEDRRSHPDEAKLFDETRMSALDDPAPNFRMEPFDFQLENFERFKDLPAWAIFSTQGSGKTKVAFDIISHRFMKGSVTGVIVLSSPKGVHSQWINEQLPKHLWEGIEAQHLIWEGKKPSQWFGNPSSQLQIVSGNIDMLRGKGYSLLEQFARQHRERLLILVDESDSIKNMNSARSKGLRKLAEVTRQRAIMTGTPIAKDLTDEFSQFYFLDPDILGHKYLTSFRAQYCIMGGFENRAVVGHKNLEQFKKLTAPYIFRATKEDLNLPPKVYDEVVFDLTKEQRRLIKEIRETFYASLESGEVSSVSSGAVALLRIQQISNGFVAVDDGPISFIDNPRLEALRALRKDISGPVVIWCRFKADVELLKQEFGANAATYYGETIPAERVAAKEAFIRGDVRELIATPGAAGKGVDGLQRVCSDAIYYSNSFNAIDRWQSEDRTDRIGGQGTASYFDLIGRGSADRGILRNLKHKKSISELALSDLKQMMDEIE